MEAVGPKGTGQLQKTGGPAWDCGGTAWRKGKWGWRGEGAGGVLWASSWGPLESGGGMSSLSRLPAAL